MTFHLLTQSGTPVFSAIPIAQTIASFTVLLSVLPYKGKLSHEGSSCGHFRGETLTKRGGEVDPSKGKDILWRDLAGRKSRQATTT